ncbi:MAG: D-2-hydroxyacid dehydrogenase [Massiliimalia sp.]|jgi:glycerate dehydrogenase
MKIVVLDGYTLNPGDLTWKLLEQLGELTVYDRTPSEKIIERIGNAKVILTNKTPITAEIIAHTNIQYIGVLATGYNVVDVVAAEKAGIVVTNIPDYGTETVAQFTIALLLELCHRIGAHSDEVFQGKWERSIEWCYWSYPLTELTNRTLGLIGFGKIGQAVAKIALAFGMKVIYFDLYNDQQYDFAQRVSLDELLEKSDVISLHCPLFESTKGIINAESISKMKTGVFLLNTSRGPLIVEEDLAQALKTGKVSGAAMDVVSVEPIEANNPLLKAPNCILTPHIAWATKEARGRLIDIAAQNVKSFLLGSPINVVNC